MNNKKSLLQDSLQELENIKNESLELAKEQLINESADLLEKKSAALFEKIIAGEDVEDEEEEDEKEEKDEEGDEEKSSKKEKKSDEKKSSKDESLSINEMLNELKDLSDEEDMDSEENVDSEEDMDSEEMGDDMEGSDEETQMSLDALRKAAEEQGFKLVQADDQEEMDDSDEEEMDDSGEEEMDDSDDEEEDIEFGDDESDDSESDDEFSSVDVDDKVLANPNDEMLNEGEKISRSQKEYNKEVDKYKFFIVDLKKKKAVSGWEFQSDAKDALSDYDKDSNFKVVAARTLSSMGIENPKENFKNPKKINENNTKMRNTKKQVLKDLRDVSFNKLVEAYYNMDEEDSFVVKENEYMEDEDEMPDYSNIGQLEEMDDEEYGMEDEGYDMENEDVMYEVDMGQDDELTDEDINEMLAEMDIEEGDDMFDESIATRTRDKYVDQGLTGPIYGKSGIDEKSGLEDMFEGMSTEELMEMEAMLQEEGEGDMGASDMGKFEADEQDLTEVQIEEMLAEMEQDEEIEESMSLKRSQSNKHQAPSPRNREERIRPLAEEDMEEVESLREQLKKLKQENKSLNEGFTNKVKSLENKVYDVTISALKAGFVNKFLLEHPLRENEKTEIVYRFANAQTKEQIKETYISLTNEFAKGQTVKDGSILNESVQNKLGKVHRTDNAIVREKNLINENDESLRFKQLLNYNFNKKK